MYIDRLVQGVRSAGGVGGERICLATRPHWFRVVKEGAGGLLLLGSGIALVLYGEQLQVLLVGLLPFRQTSGDHPGSARDAFVPPPDVEVFLKMVFTWGGVGLALVGVILLGWALLNRHFTEYAITMSPGFGGRIIKVHGVFSRQTVAVPLGMVNNLALYEPILGRILGWGDIDIETGNDYQGDRLGYVPDPGSFYEVWKTLLDHGYGRGPSASNAGSYVVMDGEANIRPQDGRRASIPPAQPGRRQR